MDLVEKGRYEEVWPPQGGSPGEQAEMNAYLSPGNAYGTVYWVEGSKRLPVICMHGGSMWLCRACADVLLGKRDPVKDPLRDKHPRRVTAFETCAYRKGEQV